MPFKIVETVENNEKELTIVPDKWENGGILSWPMKHAETLIHISETVPQEGWFNMKCVVIRSFLDDYAEAERVLGILKKSIKENGKAVSNSPKDISQLSEFISIEIEHEQNTDEILAASHQAYVSRQQPFQTSPAKPVGAYPRSHLNAILENQKYILRNQATILAQISKLNAKLEPAPRSKAPSIFTEDAPMECIDSQDAFDRFEESLKDPDTKADVKRKLSYVCGSRMGTGVNNAYFLIDVMFTREFLTKCSWSGGSRPGTRPESGKVCFKVYKRTFQCFFDVVRESDPTFTYLECEKFMRGILRNSIKRSEAKRMRTSTRKKRSKKVKTHATQDFQNEIDQ